MSARDVLRSAGFALAAAFGLGVVGLGAWKDSHVTMYVGCGIAVFCAYLANPPRVQDAVGYFGKTLGTYLPIKGGSRPADPPADGGSDAKPN